MPTEEKKSYIPSRLKNASVDGHVAGTEDIYDDGREQTQQQINEQVDQAITTLDTSISGDNIIVGTRPTTGTPGKIYRVVNNNNTYTDYMYSGGSWVTLATHDTSNEQSQVAYYTCVGTGSGALATKQFVSNGSLTYNPSNGGHIKIKMGEANTATGTIYLQFGTTTSTKKPLYYNGEPASADNTWGEGETIAVYYDPSANSNAGAYFASNAQGGGGKAEKIKYDNTQSGFTAENVQEAIDESFNTSNTKINAVRTVVDGLANTLRNVTSDEGFFITDGEGNAVLSMTEDGLDVTSFTQHFKSLVLLASGIVANIYNTDEDGFYIIDQNNYIGFGIDENGEDVTGGSSFSAVQVSDVEYAINI